MILEKIINSISWILKILGGAFLVYSYGKFQQKKSDKSKASTMVLDDIISAEKISNDVDNISNDEVNHRLQKFIKRGDKRKTTEFLLPRRRPNSSNKIDNESGH